MSVNIIYTTSAIAVGGRDGITGTTDGKFEVKVARPIELGGKGDGNNPEQQWRHPVLRWRPAASACGGTQDLCASGFAGAMPDRRDPDLILHEMFEM
jgi:hypothetical protein